MKNLAICFVALFLMIFRLQAQSLDDFKGDWISSSEMILPYVSISPSNLGSDHLQVMGFTFGEHGQRAAMLKEDAAFRKGRLYMKGRLEESAFKAELRLKGENQLEMRLITKDDEKGMVKMKIDFIKKGKEEIKAYASTSRPGQLRLWKCKECEEAKPHPVLVFIRSTKKKKTDFGLEVPAVEMELSYSHSSGNYAIYEVPELPIGTYEVFVEYKTEQADDFLIDPLPYQPEKVQALPGRPFQKSLARSR